MRPTTRVMRRSVLMFLATAAVAAALPATAGAVPRTCSSSDLRYAFQAGGPKTFGVFRLSVEGGSCPTAHRVAKRWMTLFEANIDRGSTRLPKSAAGFTFKTLPAREAQEYRQRGRRGSVTVRFVYRVPNG